MAILRHDGEKVIERFVTLIDPGFPVPPLITQLTGIDDKMLEGAPPFAAIAEKAMEMLAGRVFVAHNVSFDHSFLKREFAELGMPFLPRKLCTVRMSRKLIPEAPSYGLGRLCGYMGIGIEGRHRAGGDAEATAELFTMLLERDKKGVIEKALDRRSREATLPANLPKSHFDALPEKVGVYQFLDKSGRHLYVGKAKNIKQRVSAHFTGSGEKHRDQELKREVRSIEFLETGSELIALLEESHLIRKFWPRLNRAQKFPKNNFGVVGYVDRRGRERLAIKKILKMDRTILRGRNIPELRTELFRIADRFGLCHLLIGIQQQLEHCERAQADKPCNCNGKVSAQEHNRLLEMGIGTLDGHRDLMMVGAGRTENEESVVLIDRGTYIGYAFLKKGSDRAIAFTNHVARQHNDDTHRIIAQATRSPGYEMVNNFKKRPSIVFPPA